MLSYRQTIDCYPNGGGAYIVAKENIGIYAGVTAGAALSIDYVMTVAVSVSSGIDQLNSAFPLLIPYKVLICVGVVILLAIGNLRGIRESSKFFGIPAYLFIFAMISLIVVGFFKYFTGVHINEPVVAKGYYGIGTVSLVLLLRAFSNGCSALTGVEAISNAVPNFRDPSTKNAKMVLVLLSGIILVLIGGTSILANIYHATPGEGHQAVIVQMADLVFGRANLLSSIFFYFITSTLVVILVLAANTAFSGFPMLVSVMANEEFVPRQLKMRGDRLSFSNGIIILSVAAILIILKFEGNVNHLIGLYTIGVFISFTLSQIGMLIKWRRDKSKNWGLKAAVNGTGAIVTAIAIPVIAITKFYEGAWIVIVLIPILVFLMLKVKRHYLAISKQLRIKDGEYNKIGEIDYNNYRNRVIVPIESINKSSIRALRYAKTISDNVVAFSIAIDDEGKLKIKDNYSKLKTDIPLVIKYSPYRKVVIPLLKFIESEEYDYQRGDIITVILAQFEVKKIWHRLLHNQTSAYIKRELQKHKHIVVAIIPLQMKDDNFVLQSEKYNPENDKY